jgi:hypothetical protein
MVSMNMNLYGSTCMQKLKDPLQVAFGLNLIIEKGFEFEPCTRVCTVATL